MSRQDQPWSIQEQAAQAAAVACLDWNGPKRPERWCLRRGSCPLGPAYRARTEACSQNRR